MERRQLISIKPFEQRIPEHIYKNLENIVWDALLSQDNPEEFFAPFEYAFENLPKIAESDNQEYKDNVRTMADDVWNQNLWMSALLMYFVLLHITEFLPTDFYKFGYVLAKFGREIESIAMMEIYEKMSVNPKLTYHALANFYYCALDYPDKAIGYFEKYIELDDLNALAYNSIGHLYSKIDEKSYDKQLAFFQKAYDLQPDEPNYLKSLLNVYEKMHDVNKIKALYPKLIELAPTPRHIFNYGLYEFSWGNIQKGYDYFSQRFDLEHYPVGYPKEVLTSVKRWNYKDDISDKVLLIHYEEGFGDSIMFGRFLPLIKQFAKEVVLVLQKELVELFKNSKIIIDGIKIFGDLVTASNYIGNNEYVHMPLMDLPYPLGVDSYFIPYSSKYLSETIKKEYDTDKLNIGISYSGDLSANYDGRDVELKAFYDLARLDGVQLYSLQKGEPANQLSSLPQDVNIVDLGRTFDTFVDTANAISGLDLVISTDNVLLNLAGALGVKTLGLFNKYPNYRWFDLSGENVVWYESVKPLQCQVEDDWESLFNQVEEIVKTLI